MSSDAPRTWFADEPPGEIREVQPERYTLHEELGRGGFGRVVRGWDHALDREVAVKEVHVDAPRGVVRRFLDEAKLTAQLEHPNIVPIHDAGERPDGTLYYVMRLVRGRSLHEAVVESTSPDARLRLLPHVEDACQAMAYAHDRGVLHRDLKPANLMLGEHGETLVVDWGIARLLARGAPGAVEGTPAYMSPEQARGEPLDERSDVWSLGAVLFEVLAGVPPFHGADPATLLERVRSQAPPRLLDVSPGAPRELAAIVDKALTVSREGRYRSATDLAADVSAWRDGRRVDAYAYRPRELLALLARRYRLPLGTLAVGLSVAAFVAAGAFFRVAAARDRAEAAETELRASLAEALTRAAREELASTNTTGAALLAAESLRLVEGPAPRGWLALALGAAPWRHEATHPFGPCVDARTAAGWTWCAGPDVVKGASGAGASWEAPAPGAWRIEPSPDGSRLVASAPTEWVLFDGHTGAVLRRVAASRPSQVAWSADAGRFAVAELGQIAVLDRDGAVLYRRPPGSAVQGLSFGPDGALRYVTASGWYAALLPNPAPGPPAYVPGPACTTDESVVATAFHPREPLVASVTFVRSLELLDPRDCVVHARAPAESERIRSIAWHPDLDILVGGDEQGGLTTWTRSLERTDRVRLRTSGLARPQATTGGLLVPTEAGATRLAWVPERRASVLTLPGGPSGVVPTDAGLWVSVRSRLHLIDPADGEERDVVDLGSTVRALTGTGEALAALVGEDLLLFGPGPDRVVHVGLNDSAQAHPTLPWILVLGDEGTLLVDRVRAEAHDLGTEAGRWGLAPSPDGWWARTGDGAGWVTLAPDGATAPIAGTEDLEGVAFSPAGRRAELRSGRVTLDDGLTVAVPPETVEVSWFGEGLLAAYTPSAWRVYRTDGRHVATLPGHSGRIVAERTVERRLVTASWDGELRQWNLAALDTPVDRLGDALHVATGARVEGAQVVFAPP